MSDNQRFGSYAINRAREWQLFDRLPRELREVFSRAPYHFAIEPRFNELMSVPPAEARAAMIEGMCETMMKFAKEAYGPDHPDAQRSRLARRAA